jgi:hypothetical protein
VVPTARPCAGRRGGRNAGRLSLFPAPEDLLHHLRHGAGRGSRGEGLALEARFRPSRAPSDVPCDAGETPTGGLARVRDDVVAMVPLDGLNTSRYEGAGMCAGVKTTAALVALAGLSMTTEAAEPTTLTLACKGTQISRGRAGTTSEQIDIGIIFDFQKKKVIGLSDDPDSITGFDETRISFASTLPGWVMSGTIDRLTGWLLAGSIKSELGTGKEILSFSY